MDRYTAPPLNTEARRFEFNKAVKTGGHFEPKGKI